MAHANVMEGDSFATVVEMDTEEAKEPVYHNWNDGDYDTMEDIAPAVHQPFCKWAQLLDN